MHSGFASLPKRKTTRRDSSDRMAWSTCQAEGRWVRKTEPMVAGVCVGELKCFGWWVDGVEKSVCEEIG
jgi:hypothetical protein